MTRYAIIEDEAIAARRLQMAIERLRPDWTLAFSSQSVEESARCLGNSSVDLLFMDIELSDGQSFDILDHVNIECPVVFTTAYDEYAIKAFRLHSIDYLLKPISDGDLALAISKYERLSPGMRTPDYQALRTEISDGSHERLLLQTGDSYSYVNISDIAYIVSEDNLVFVYPHSGPRRLTAYTSLGELQSRLPSNRFFQISRGVITSIEAVKSVSKYFRGRLLVKLTTNGKTEEVTVPAARRDEFLSWLGR